MYTSAVYFCAVITRVEISKRVLKQLRKLPQHIVDALLEWVLAVEELGLQEVRKIPGYHDEPLRGNRAGQRSIRLSRSYRAMYEIRDDGTVEFAFVLETNNHDY